MCRLFIGKKFRKKIIPNPALYPLSKISDSGMALKTFNANFSTVHRRVFAILPHFKRRSFLQMKAIRKNFQDRTKRFNGFNGNWS